MNIRNKIIELCNDSTLSERQLYKKLEDIIGDLLPYDHNERRDLLKACNLESDDVKLNISAKGSVSEIIERIEKSLTKRELAFVLLDVLRDQMTKQESSQSSFSDLFGLSDNTEKSIEEKCDEEDDSECWKCKHKGICKKFK